VRRSVGERLAGSSRVAQEGEATRREGFPVRPRRWTWIPVVAGAVLATGGWAVINALLGDAAEDDPEVRSIAVLPLANLTGDPEQDYFAAAMHDLLVAELSRTADLTVLSRQSVLRYRESDQPLPVIGRELGVDVLVEGAVFVAGDSVRVTAQLIRASPEEHLWSDVFLGARGGVLALQGEVAQAIARAVRARLAPEESWLPVRSRTEQPRAQEAYLNGLYHLTRQALMLSDATPDVLEDVVTAIGHLEEAVVLEPEWAAAHAKLALAYHWLASRFRSRHAEEFFPKARAAALRALELDEDDSQAHAVLGFVLYQQDWDWEGAERSFRRALELDPNSHHHAYALFLQSAGRLDEAIVHFRRAEERDPLSERLKHQLTGALRCAGRYDEAIVQLRELEVRLGRDPRPDQVAWLGHGLARAYAGKSMLAEAITELERAVALTDSLPLAVAGLAEMYAQGGRLDEARTLLARLEERAGDRLGRPAQLLAALGETDRAVTMLEDALGDPSQRGALTNFRCTESYRLLAHEPRIQAIVEQMGYPN
jgi:TolB-like protein/Tfp pilus assembly protein PilF